MTEALNLSSLLVRESSFDQIVDLRHRILRAGLPRQTALWDGDHAPDTHHFAAILDGRAVACATLMLNQWQGQPAFQLRGMAAEEPLRGKGVGRKLLELVERTARHSGKATMLWCNARTPAVEFYRKQGWQTVGDEFFIPTAGPHFKMFKAM